MPSIEPKVDGIRAVMTFGPDGIKVSAWSARIDRVTPTGPTGAEALTAVVGAIEEGPP